MHCCHALRQAHVLLPGRRGALMQAALASNSRVQAVDRHVPHRHVPAIALPPVSCTSYPRPRPSVMSTERRRVSPFRCLAASVLPHARTQARSSPHACTGVSLMRTVLPRAPLQDPCASAHATVWALKLVRCVQVWEEMKAAGVEGNTYVYIALINACERSGDWQRAVQVFYAMKVCPLLATAVSMDPEQLQLARHAVLVHGWKGCSTNASRM